MAAAHVEGRVSENPGGPMRVAIDADDVVRMVPVLCRRCRAALSVAVKATIASGGETQLSFTPGHCCAERARALIGLGVA